MFSLSFIHFSPKSEISNPKCDDSSKRVPEEKTLKVPSRGSTKPGPLKPDFLQVR